MLVRVLVGRREPLVGLLRLAPWVRVLSLLLRALRLRTGKILGPMCRVSRRRSRRCRSR